MLDYLLFILLFILSFFVVRSFIVRQQVDKFKKRSSILATTKENSFEKILTKINFIKTKEKFLLSQGYPLNLNGISYYIIKTLLTLILAIAGLVNYESYLAMIVLGVIGYTFLDIYIYVHKKTRDSEICVDLLAITDSLTISLASYVPLEEALKNQYENCKNKDFKKAIMMFSTNFKLSELNVNKALDELRSKFDILEVDMFCNTIEQYNKLGNIDELLENMSSVLKLKYIDKLKENTRTKVIYITMGVIIALANIIMITFYPLFVSVGNNFNQIFK